MMEHFSGHEVELMIRAIGVMQGIKEKQGDTALVDELEYIAERLYKLHKKVTGGIKRVQ